MQENIYEYIKTQETTFSTIFVPITNSFSWNFRNHVERCTNVASGHFHGSKNDGILPYDDIVSSIIDVAFRLEGFDVKDIVPYVDDIKENYKSFLIKKYHPQWAKENELDTFIDEVVESSIIYDLVLVKNINNVRPEVVNLQDIAFCDQTDILSGPICIRHEYSIPELLEFKGKWDDKKIDEVIVMARASKKVALANNQEVKTPGKYIECFELYGSFPESWLKDDGDPEKYVWQLHIINYYTASDGSKNGITLFKGKDKKMGLKFKALKIDTVRSKGRACGRSIVERLFEPQVWRNYSGIKLKKMLDASINLLQTDSEEYGNKKISELKENTIIKHEVGRPVTRIDMQLQNVGALQSYGVQMENSARTLGSASEASLGKNPVSGTPFALQSLIVQEGKGIHDYRQGKIATFFSDVLYKDWILKYLVEEMNNGKRFSEELSLDEMNEISDNMSVKYANDRIKASILSGKLPTKEEQVTLTQFFKEQFKKGGSRKFFEVLKEEINDIPVKVKMNIAGKQKDLARNADSLTNIIRTIMSNPQAIQQIPGLAKIFNQLLESSNLSPIDFTTITTLPEATQSPQGQLEASQVPQEAIESPLQTNNLTPTI